MSPLRSSFSMQKPETKKLVIQCSPNIVVASVEYVKRSTSMHPMLSCNGWVHSFKMDNELRRCKFMDDVRRPLWRHKRSNFDACVSCQLRRPTSFCCLLVRVPWAVFCSPATLALMLMSLHSRHARFMPDWLPTAMMAPFLDDRTTRKRPDVANVVRDGCANAATFGVTQSHRRHVSQFNKTVERETTRKCTPHQSMLQRESKDPLHNNNVQRR